MTQKTILVDAWNTFVTPAGINKEMFEMLEKFPNQKIILTNANPEQQEQFGMKNLPYPLFTLNKNPSKIDPSYYQRMIEHFSLSVQEVVYFEHNEKAVASAQSVGIKTYHYDKEAKDVQAVKRFLEENLKNF